jgi:outer membrane protein assembly factor BamB
MSHMLCKITFAIVIVALGLLLPGMAHADGGWPQFRGPSQQGYAESADLPTTWSETQNVTWKTNLPGQGWSSPVILDKQIWITTATEDGQSLRALCVDEDSGKITHDVEVFAENHLEPKNDFNSYASPTPVIEHGRVYVSFGTYGNACLETNSGAVIWRNTNLRLDHKEGPGSSPILWKNYFLLHCDGMDVQYLAALNKSDGSLAYKSERSYPLQTLRDDLRKAYSTPTVAKIDGNDQLISVGSRRVYGYDPLDGREFWHCDLPGFSNAPRPVFADGIVFVSTGYNNAELWAIDPHAQGPDHVTSILWKWTKGAPLKPSIIVVDGLVYFTSDGGIARCLDEKTGEQQWQGRLVANSSASPIYAHGLIYFFDEHGKAACIRPGKTLDKVDEAQLDGRILASPAVDGNALFIRTDSALYRIEKK